MYKRAHVLLRGRYRYLLPIAMVLGLAGALFGYRSQPVMYCSVGLIRIAPTLPAIMQATDQNQPTAMYYNFLRSQLLLIGSRPVLEAAAADPQLKASCKGYVPGPDELGGLLQVDNPPDSQSITVAFFWPDPDVAAACVRAIISSYLKAYDRNEAANQEQRLAVLSDRIAALTSQIAQVHRQIKQTVIIPTPTSIAQRDPMMASYISQQQAMQIQIDNLLNLGYGPNLPALRSAQTQLDALNLQIEKYRQAWTSLKLADAIRPTDHRTPSPLFPELHGLEKKLDELTRDREGTIHRQDVLKTEAGLGARRVSVGDWGGPPEDPILDTRRSRAAVYGLLGVFGPLIGFLAFALIERRYRYADQLAGISDALPMLGVVPEFSKGMGDEEVARITANCAHHVRVQLQLRLRKRPRRVFMVTSAASSDGKTSVTLTLGFSFASAGSRTLLIDSDIVGRGLSMRMEADEAPGLIDCLEDSSKVNFKQITPNLWLLSAGRKDRDAAMVMTPEKFHELIAATAKAFDTVLIDTGPMPASLQASVVATSADQAIVVVAQGQTKASVMRTVSSLRTAGSSSIAGFVFNRAKVDDYYRSIGGAANAHYYKTVRRHNVADAMGLQPYVPPVSAEPALTPAGPAATPAPQLDPAWHLPPAAAAPRSRIVVNADAPDVLIGSIGREPLPSIEGGSGLFGLADAISELAVFSDEHLSLKSIHPLPVVTTVINGPSAPDADPNSGNKGFAAPQPDGQIDPALQAAPRRDA